MSDIPARGEVLGHVGRSETAPGHHSACRLIHQHHHTQRSHRFEPESRNVWGQAVMMRCKSLSPAQDPRPSIGLEFNSKAPGRSCNVRHNVPHCRCASKPPSPNRPGPNSLCQRSLPWAQQSRWFERIEQMARSDIASGFSASLPLFIAIFVQECRIFRCCFRITF